MPNIYAILGNANTRKSSLVRSLTGVGRRKVVQLQTPGGTIDIFVQISSLQEAEILPATFITEVQNSAHQHVLVPLSVSGLFRNGTAYPDGRAYIGRFINAGWNISQIVLLGIAALPHLLPAGSPKLHTFASSTTTPVNRIAFQVRAWWNWV
jgi:hypothetical protein